MFTGYLSRTEMEVKHPLELADIDAGLRPKSDEETARRRRLYLPAYSAFSVLLLVGIYVFVTFEDTAIQTIEPPEIVEVFVTTPRPTIPLRPEPPPTVITTTVPGQIDTWDATIGDLFANSCGVCHGEGGLGGLNLTTYAGALAGGNSGEAVVPGDVDASIVVEIQLSGGHPGQWDDATITRVSDWIAEGAAEN